MNEPYRPEDDDVESYVGRIASKDSVAGVIDGVRNVAARAGAHMQDMSPQEAYDRLLGDVVDDDTFATVGEGSAKEAFMEQFEQTKKYDV